jgi:hypothetical protein
MGNKVTHSSLTGVFSEFEHLSGRMLLEAIRKDSAEKTQEAIDLAKSEFSKPVSLNTNQADYDEMIEYMSKYLTKQYDIGDGPFFTKSPLEYCREKRAKSAEEVIKNNLKKFHFYDINPNESSSVKIVSETVGTIDSERVTLAKQRLQEFRNSKK